MALTGANIRAALAAVGAVGGQMTSFDNLAAGANDALRRAPAGLTPAGAAAFLATMAQESAYFRTTTEYSAGKNRYSPYDGRTFEMITWEPNYRGFGKWCKSRGLVTDSECFVKNPRSLADYRWAWDGGVWFFQANSLWKYANAGNFLAVSQGVNGGNGTIGSSWKPSGWTARNAMYQAFHALGNALLPTGHAAPATYYDDLAHWFTTAQIKQLQTKLGVTADGIVGVNTIKAVQRVSGVTQDAVVGPNTVKGFQKVVGVAQDGKLGPKTAAAAVKWSAPAAKPPVKKPTTPKGTAFPLPKGHAYAVNDGTVYTHSGVSKADQPAIKTIQRKVGVTADGIYGAKTKAAVKTAQKSKKVSVDGEVGAKTWAALGL